jgi:hypothetical protein
MEHLLHIKFFATSLTTSQALAALGITHTHLLSHLASLKLTTLRQLALQRSGAWNGSAAREVPHTLSGPNVIKLTEDAQSMMQIWELIDDAATALRSQPSQLSTG